MRLQMPCILVVTSVTVLFATPARAQGPAPGGGCGRGGWGRHGTYWRLYDPSKVETISGEVTSIQRVRAMGHMSEGVHLELKTTRGTVSVHLGPAWYIENQEPPIRARDKVVIVGSRVQVNGKQAIIASEVRKGDQVLKLRTAEGDPRWCGWRRHSMGARAPSR